MRHCVLTVSRGDGAEMPDEREAVIKALKEGLLNAWDWAIVEDTAHGAAGRAMAEAALKCLEANGFKVVRADTHIGAP